MEKPAIRKYTISVIVPVYKVEPWLRDCIDSILNQTFQDFELILIDDGSPDHCGLICDEYAAREERVVVIHQKNAGVAAARNAGLDWVFANSDSQWVTFVDSDDVILPNYLECLHQYAMENNADIVTTHCRYIQQDTAVSSIQQKSTSIQCIMSGRTACLSFYQGEGKLTPMPWGKLIKLETIGEIRFPVDLKWAEDQEFVIKTVYRAEQVVVLNAWLYGYRNRPGSVVQEPFSMKRYDYFKNVEACIQYFRERNEHEIAELAEKNRKNTLIRYTLMAHGAKILDRVPSEYKIPLWKAFLLEVGRTIREGGPKVFARRIQTYLKELGRKKW